MSDVVRWETVTVRWLGHRPEPLISERLWGCPLVLDDGPDPDGWHHRVGFDEHDRPVVVRHEYAQGSWQETVSYAPGRIEVHYGDGHLTTTFDERGRAERTVYVRESGGHDVETYEYDADGRLVGINEPEMLDATAQGGRGIGWGTGGPVSVEHDADGVTRIVEDQWGTVVWTRPDEPWPVLLERSVQSMFDEAVRAITAAVERSSSDTMTSPALALTLDFTQGSGLGCFGRLLLDADDLPPMHVHQVLLPRRLPTLQLGDLLEMEDLGLQAHLLQQASAQQPADPVRFVLSALGTRLAEHDWTGVFQTASEFAVFLDEHDTGPEPMWRSLVAINPPERVARWRERWPQS